ncbi:MAG: glycosyltransferase family 2 protein [Ilumatobacteraceae bacterium]
MGVTDKSGTPATCEITILMPCLDEAETLAACIAKAYAYLQRRGIDGEVLIADNGSTDGSQQLAADAGARVVEITQRGYGSALLGGIRAARGRFVIMGDADDSYDFSHLDAFVDELRAGRQLVMGNRFSGGIEPGAMPWLHRRIGNPVLSWIGRTFFRVPVGDFHCGLRGFDRDAVLGLGLRTTGMEFASELVVRASLERLSISEVPTTLSRDGRSRPPHLRSWRDGWRHLRFLLIYSPRWLFLYPGIVAMTIGALTTAALLIGPIEIGSVALDVATLIYAAALVVLGYQAALFSLVTRYYATQRGFLPASRSVNDLADRWSLERGLVAGGLIFACGLLVGLLQVFRWSGEGFGQMNTRESVSAAIPAMLGLTLGFQTIMFSMFASILSIPVQDAGEAGDQIGREPAAERVAASAD